MPVVITIDQRRSRSSENRAMGWANELNERFWVDLTLPFVVTVGDEIQGVTPEPGVAIEILLEGVRSRSWWLGLGLGRIETPVGESAARSRGPAFYEARKAVESAKRSRYGFAVEATDAEAAREIQTVIDLLAFVVKRRGNDPQRWRAIELAWNGSSTVEIGRALGITQQAASKRLLNAGVEEERAGRQLAEKMMRTAMQ
jgi:hypothetical protein